MSRPIRRTSSSFIIGFQQLKDQIELKEHAERLLKEKDKDKEKESEKPGDKKGHAKKGKDKTGDAIKESEAFRNMTEHRVPLSELSKQLETDLERGLQDDKAHEKLKIFGENKLSEKVALPWYCLFFKQLTGFFSLLLWVGSGLCFIAYGLNQADPSNMYLGIVLAVVVFLTGCFSFYQESQSAAIMAGFKNMIPPTCTVVREGTVRPAESSKLVPGDIVMLKAGARIPADVRILEASNFKVDNSSLTGESEPQTRTENCTNEHNPLETENLAFFGTMASSGEGKGLVVFTGDNTIMGRIANLASSTETEETTLGKEISRFVKMISIIAVSLGIIFFILGFIYGYGAIVNMVNAIGIIVANVPEGLLATVTVALTLTAKRMAAKNVLVKNLEAVETLGSTTCICSDKTGTLTENKMRVVNTWYDGKIRGVENYEERNSVPELGYDINDPTFLMLQRCASLNSKAQFSFEPEAKVFVDKDGNKLPNDQCEAIKAKFMADTLAQSIQMWPTVGGDASEIALIKFFNPIYEINKIRGEYPTMMREGVKAEILFNSANKYAVTLHEPCDWNPKGHQNDAILFMKGAPEQLWERCSKMMDHGKEVPITDEWKEKFDKANKAFGGQGQRVLGFAYLWLEESKYPKNYVFDPNLEDGPNFPLKGLTFIGLMALMDPPRKRVKEAVISCHEAGIKVIMVTGDQPLTAAAIARQVHIITEPKTVNELCEEGMDWDTALEKSDAIVIHGDMLTKAHAEDEGIPFREQRIAKWLSKTQIVFARTSPAQKFMIVDANQQLKQIVAVTGDGVNDSPAIKKADIGIAMNIVGSDVAKDAADMLLIDDNFASIVDGVKEGRVIFDNLKKTIAYILASNIPELAPFLSLIIFQLPLPMSTVLILCIDLGTDIMPAIAIAYESAELDIMRRNPRNAEKDFLVTGQLLFYAYVTMGAYECMAGYMAYFVVMNDYGFTPQILWFLALRDDGTRPASDDIYDPYLEYKGNSHVGQSDYDGELVDYISDYDGKYDLRIWYYKISHDDWADCKYPNMISNVSDKKICYTTEALRYAQCAFFIAIVVTQWSNILNVKTRTLSFLQQGITNKILMFSLVFETAVALFLCYVPPLNIGLGTRQLTFLHWGFPAVPFFITMMLFDEGRKWLIRISRRRNPKVKGWVDLNTYY